MKKFVKLSLVAAVAVAGLTTANAKPLEEAIKDVDVSGTVVYRYDDRNRDINPSNVQANQNSTVSNNYKVGLNLKAKVNDDVSANFRFVTSTGTGTNLDFASLDTSNNTVADANPSIHLTNVYFGYTGIANTTVNVGKQGLTTPWTVAVDSDGNEQNGAGILALSTVGPVTLAAAYFNQTNLNVSGNLAGVAKGSEDIYAFAAMTKVGPVSLDAWYLDMADLFDTYTLGANTSFDLDGVKLGLDLRYTSLTMDNTVVSAAAGHGTDTDNDMIRVAVTAKAGIVDGKVVYAQTDKKGGLVSLDVDTTNGTQGWMVNLTNKRDADYLQAVVGVQLLDTLHISANYVSVDHKATLNSTVETEEEEVYAQLTYNMSKNLSTYVRFGQYESKVQNAANKSADDTRGRLQVQYSF